MPVLVVGGAFCAIFELLTVSTADTWHIFFHENHGAEEMAVGGLVCLIAWLCFLLGVIDFGFVTQARNCLVA